MYSYSYEEISGPLMYLGRGTPWRVLVCDARDQRYGDENKMRY